MMGPVTISDKSFLESLNPNESVWLEQFFIMNMVPLLHIETLGDLSKTTKPDRSPEKLVKDLANKTPQQEAYYNIHAGDLVIQELLGYKVNMTNRPIISNGETVTNKDGETVFQMRETFEEGRLNRWQQGKFKNLERIFSTNWRNSLSQLTKNEHLNLVKNLVPSNIKFKNFEDIYEFTLKFIKTEDENILYLIQELLHIPNKVVAVAINRWNSTDGKSILDIAPYTAYVLSVEIFYYLSISEQLISREDVNNRTDLLYLHYLPFTDIFVSTDHLHKTIVPLFLKNNQIFISGQELKTALAELQDYFDHLPDEVKARGVISFSKLPTNFDNLVCRIWDKYFPNWRTIKQNPKLSKEDEATLIAKIKALQKASTNGDLNIDNVDHIIRTYQIKAKKGDWSMLPPEVTNSKKLKIPFFMCLFCLIFGSRRVCPAISNMFQQDPSTMF